MTENEEYYQIDDKYWLEMAIDIKPMVQRFESVSYFNNYHITDDDKVILDRLIRYMKNFNANVDVSPETMITFVRSHHVFDSEIIPEETGQVLTLETNLVLAIRCCDGQGHIYDFTSSEINFFKKNSAVTNLNRIFREIHQLFEIYDAYEPHMFFELRNYYDRPIEIEINSTICPFCQRKSLKYETNKSDHTICPFCGLTFNFMKDF